jgi:hypothetical protein
VSDGTDGWSYPLMWKFFGYIGGAVVLHELISGVGSLSARPTNSREVAPFLSAAASAALRRLQAVAAFAVSPGDRRTTGNLVRLRAQVVEKLEQQGGGAVDPIYQAIDAMFKSLPFQVGSADDPSVPPLVRELEAPGFELRADDLRRIQMGEEPEDLKELKNFKMPLPGRSEATTATENPFEGKR